MSPRFLFGESALLLDRTLVISDVHIGIELEFRRSGMKMPSQTPKLQERILRLLTETKATHLVICGDFKHKVPGTSMQEAREIPRFLAEMQRHATVQIAQGNHDADLAPLLPPGVTLHPTEGFLQGRAYFSHGHTWPSTEFARAEYLIVGHVQPQIEIKDHLGYVWREPVWVRSPLREDEVLRHYPNATHMPELIILPAFNPLAGGLALNKNPIRESPLLKLADLAQADIFLKDGTLLGKLTDL